MVGHSRRGQWKPDAEFLYAASAALGQTLMEPPSVKGWDGGFAWLTESSFLLRSNLWGGVLGQISPKDLRDQVAAAVDEMDDLMGVGEDEEMSGGGMQEEGSGQETAPEPKRRGGPLARILGTIGREKMAIDFPILSQLGERRITGDQAIANHLLDRLLAIEAPAETRLQVRQFIKKGRKQLKIKAGKLHEGGVPAKSLLFRTIHLILSLPEAQLH